MSTSCGWKGACMAHSHSDCGWTCGCAGKTDIPRGHAPYLSASAVMIHYEEALYQVYAPLPLSLMHYSSALPDSCKYSFILSSQTLYDFYFHYLHISGITVTALLHYMFCCWSYCWPRVPGLLPVSTASPSMDHEHGTVCQPILEHRIRPSAPSSVISRPTCFSSSLRCCWQVGSAPFVQRRCDCLASSALFTNNIQTFLLTATPFCWLLVLVRNGDLETVTVMLMLWTWCLSNCSVNLFNQTWMHRLKNFTVIFSLHLLCRVLHELKTYI